MQLCSAQHHDQLHAILPQSLSCLLKCNQSAGEHEKREVVTGFAFPADQKGTVTIVPAVGSFDDPATRFAPNAAKERGLTAAADVRDNASGARFGFGLAVVVAFVETQVHGAANPTTASQWDGVERFSNHPLVVNVGASDLNSQGNTTRIGQHMALDASLGAVRRVGTGQVPPLGALTMALSRLHHFQSMPRVRS